MASLPNPRTVTYGEWLRMPETKNVEVVNGELRIMSAPKWVHARIIQNLYDQFRPQVSDRDVIIVNSPFDLIIRQHPLTTRIPDLAVFQAATVVERDGRIFSPPQLVVEVRSPANTSRERQEKLADCASLGVPEAWAFSPDDRSVEVLYLEDTNYLRHAILTEGILKPKLFPDVQVDIAAIWPA